MKSLINQVQRTTALYAFTNHNNSSLPIDWEDQPSVNRPDVATKDVGDGCADKVGLACDGGLISGANLLPLVVATFPLLISNIFLHTRLGLGSVGCRSFCQEKKDKSLFKKSSNNHSGFLLSWKCTCVKSPWGQQHFYWSQGFTMDDDSSFFVSWDLCFKTVVLKLFCIENP